MKTKYDIVMPAQNRNAIVGGSRKRPSSTQANVGDKNIAANASANVPKNVREPTSPFMKNRARKWRISQTVKSSSPPAKNSRQNSGKNDKAESAKNAPHPAPFETPQTARSKFDERRTSDERKNTVVAVKNA